MAHAPERAAQSTFLADVAKLASATGLAQLIGVLAAPFLARLYAPGAYGVLAVFVSIASIVGVVACLRYELAIVLPAEDDKAANLAAVCVLVATLVGLLLVPLVWLTGDHIAAMFNAPQIAPYLWLIPVVALVQGAHHAFTYWSTRTKRYGRLSVAAVTGSATTTGGRFGAAFAGYAGGTAMILTRLAGQFLATLMLAVQVLRDNGRFFRDCISLHAMRRAMVRHRKFPLVSSWAALLNIVSWQLPVFVLGAFFSPQTVGFYALGFQMLQLPMSLFGRSISQVFLQRAAVARTSGTLDVLVRNLLEVLIIVGLLPMAILALVGEEAFAVVFGDRWREAGVYVQILSAWVFVWFISSPLSTLFAVLEKQESGLALQVVIFVTRLVALGAGGLTGDARLTLGLFAAAGVLAYGYLSLKTLRFADVSVRAAGGILFRHVLFCLPFAAVVAVASMVEMPQVWLLAIAALVTAAYMFIQRRRLVELLAAESLT